MKRWGLFISVLLALCCLTLIGFGSWLLGSNYGAKWLIKTVANAFDVQVTTGRLEGRLADDLIIEELQVVWPAGQLTARRMQLDWQPFSSFQQKLHIHVLEVDQLVIQNSDNTSSSKTSSVDEKGSGFAATDLAFLPDWLTVQIDRLQLQGVTLQDDEGGVVIAEEISGAFLWLPSQIKSSDFSYRSPSVDLQGDFDWDLQQSHLEMTADVHLPETLIEPRLFQKIAVPVDFPAQISLDGDWNAFSGPVRFGKLEDVHDNVWLSADAKGSWQGIRFDNLQGRYLNGSLAGELELAWIDSYRMSGELSGNGLTPGNLIADLAGRTRLDLSGELLIPYDDQPLRASLGAIIHEAHLRGHTIAGSLAADWQDGSLHDIKLDLTGKGVRVVASGKPAERVELDLAVSDLSPSYPGLDGQLQASGWLRWADDYLTGEVHGSGTGIAWQETSFNQVVFSGQHLTQKAPLKLQLDGRGFRYAGLQIEHLLLDVKGTLEKHDVQLSASGLAGDLALQLTGQYREKAWLGELQTLSGGTPELGTWSLEKTTSVSWKSEVGSLENLVMVSRRGERVTFKISEWGSQSHAKLAMTWQDLNHDWLAYLQPSHGVSGHSSGELLLEMAAQQPASLKARVTADADLQNNYSVITVPVLTAEALWTNDGLDFHISADSNIGEHLEASARSSEPLNWQWPPDQLSLDLLWKGVNLERLSRFRKNLEAQGHSDGHVQLEIEHGQLLNVIARISAKGFLQQKDQPVGFRSVLADLNWDAKHFQCSAHIEGANGGLLDLTLTSTDTPHLAWPGFGQINLEIDRINLQSLNPLMPAGVTLKGIVRGKSIGYWRDSGQIVLDGQVKFADSGLILQSSEGRVDIQVPQADVSWQWQDDHLKGSLMLQLAKEGELHGSWQLPLPARWPINLIEDGALQASLQGQLRATGMLTALAPGLVQDLRGQINSDLRLSGTWQNPVFSGQLTLHEAGAYLPANGVTIEDVKLRATLHDKQIKIDEFSLRSGSGTLNGSGVLDFERWQLEHYQLAVKGERLQVYNFPELLVLSSPDLTLTGDLEKIKIEGRLLIPEMSLLGSATTPEALPSTDVIIFGETQDRHRALPIDADIQVTLELGDQIRVKTAGVDTRLKGEVLVTLDEQDHLALWGEINLVEGVYKAYGANLGIKQGLLKYSGGSVDNPKLSILATRDVGTVQAGVQVTGTAEAPVVSLYSQPAMPERDILGYIFMGRPMRAGQEGEDALMIGAGALMPGYGGTFSDFGISEIDIQGLFDGSGGVSVRKRLAESWEIESTLGVESGVDLYYLIKFD